MKNNYFVLLIVSLMMSEICLGMSDSEQPLGPSALTIRDIPVLCMNIVKRFSSYEGTRFPLEMKDKLDCDIVAHFTNSACRFLYQAGRVPYRLSYRLAWRGINQPGEHALCEHGRRPDEHILKDNYEKTLDELTTGWRRQGWRDWRMYLYLKYPLSFSNDPTNEWILIVKNTAPENTDVIMQLLIEKLKIEGVCFADCVDPEDDGDWPGPLRPMAYGWIHKDSYEKVVAELNLRIE